MTDIEFLIQKKEELKLELIRFQKKINNIENKLIDIEKELAQFSDVDVADNLILSEQQKKIVISNHKNILVIACPGSGKTHTLISRYIYLVLKKNINPENVILITFTKKAGQEMNKRLSNIIPNKLPYYVGSIHGLGYKILQEFNNTNYTVLDEKEAKYMIKNIINDELKKKI